MVSPLRFVSLVSLAVAAGVSFVIQQAVNARLRAALGSAAWAGFASYFGGTVAMLAIIVIVHEPWMTRAGMARAPWWAWTGGAFGAVYILASILLLPRLGAATVVAGIVVGQMLASIAFDHFGVLGLAAHPVGIQRIVGAAFLIVGVWLVRS